MHIARSECPATTRTKGCGGRKRDPCIDQQLRGPNTTSLGTRINPVPGQRKTLAAPFHTLHRCEVGSVRSKAMACFCHLSAFSMQMRAAQ